MNIPTITKIIKSTIEATDVKTITFRYPGTVIPGQFYMIWIPGVDEIPMSVSHITDDTKAITFEELGMQPTRCMTWHRGVKSVYVDRMGTDLLSRKASSFRRRWNRNSDACASNRTRTGKKLQSTIILGVKQKLTSSLKVASDAVVQSSLSLLMMDPKDSKDSPQV